MASVFKTNTLQQGINTSQTEVFNWEDVATRAQQYIDTVREQAQKMLEDSRLECNRIRAEAREEGIRGGENHVERLAMQMAEQIAEKRVQEAAKSVRNLCDEIEQATNKWLRQWQHETVSLSIAITEKLVMRQIESDPTILLNWIEESIRLVQGQRQLMLRIHPEDAQRLSSALNELVQDLNPSLEIKVTEDVSVGRFGVILETPESTIDRSLNTQLKRLAEELQ